MGASITRTQINSLGAEWRNQIQIGEKPRVFSEFYQPLDFATNYFIAPQVSYEERNINLFRPGGKGDILAQYRVKQAVAGVDVGRGFENWGEFRIGIRRGYGVTRINIGDPSQDSGSYNVGALYSAFSYNTLDNFGFPLKGSSADIAVMTTLQELGSDVKSNALSMSWLTVKTWDKITVVPSVSYSGVFGGARRSKTITHLEGFSIYLDICRMNWPASTSIGQADLLSQHGEFRSGGRQRPTLPGVLGRGGQCLAEPERYLPHVPDLRGQRLRRRQYVHRARLSDGRHGRGRTPDDGAPDRSAFLT